MSVPYASPADVQRLRPTMPDGVELMIGFDLHKRESQLAMRGADGQLCERRIMTSRERLSATLGGPRARILLEASTESEWVAQHLEALGHDVIVADPTYAPMYAHRSRRTKTDKRDARALLEACERGVYRPAHRLSHDRRQLRTELAVRDALVSTRSRYVVLAKTLVRAAGLRVPSGASEDAAARITALPLEPSLRENLTPLLQVIDALDARIAAADQRLVARGQTEPIVALLQTAPAIGPVIATAFVATIDDIARFASAHALEAYLGLVPSEHSSGEKRRLGGITKAGNTRMRSLLVQASWTLLRSKRAETAELRRWALRIAARRGKAIAAVALARRLAGILYAMWRDGQPYDARPGRRSAPIATR